MHSTSSLATLLLAITSTACVAPAEPSVDDPGDTGDTGDGMHDEMPMPDASMECENKWRQLSLSPGTAVHTILGNGVVTAGVKSSDTRAERNLLSLAQIDYGPISFSVRFANLTGTQSQSGMLVGAVSASLILSPQAGGTMMAYAPRTGDYSAFQTQSGEIQVELAGGAVDSESTWTIELVPDSGEPPLTASGTYTVEANLFPPMIQLFAVAGDTLEVDLDHAEVTSASATLVDEFDCIGIDNLD